jgi:hypothetical protein
VAEAVRRVVWPIGSEERMRGGRQVVYALLTPDDLVGF